MQHALTRLGLAKIQAISLKKWSTGSFQMYAYRDPVRLQSAKTAKVEVPRPPEVPQHDEPTSHGAELTVIVLGDTGIATYVCIHISNSE